MDGGAGEAEAMELVNTFLLANCCRLLEGSWFLSAAQFSSSSMDLIRIQYLPGACCVGGVLSHLNGKPRGRAAKSSTHEGLRAETTGLSQWLCEKCLSGSSSWRVGAPEKSHILAGWLRVSHGNAGADRKGRGTGSWTLLSF